MPRRGFSRSLFHLATGLTLALGISQMGRETGLVALGVLFTVTLLTEILRLSLPPVNGIFTALFGPMLKEAEFRRPTGVGYYLGGALATLYLFDLEPALAGLVILAVGDPAAAIIGKRWGRVRIGRKSLEGTLAFIACALTAGLLFRGFWPEISVVPFAAGVLAAALVELLPLKIDDNLILPPVAALAITVAAG